MFRVFKAFTYTSDTHELLGPCDAYTDETHDILPFHTEIKPIDKKKGFAVVFNEKNQEWEYQEDHRGLVLFDTKSRQSVTIEKLGKVPNYLTPLAPKSEYDVWDGERWVKNIEAENLAKRQKLESIKQQKLFDATQIITPLQDAVDLNMMTEEEKVKLTEWKKYRVLLNRVDTSTASDIEWPKKP
ncbi:MAG TPA: tail fiber assembly protein [Arsenophonus apicola]|uniref:tail fiber assembly protein n=1 Tax=Arsenophonus apicola TaxID=2879119 RepID=UPI001CDB7CBF|nr:tail fiber assembly protein [Arsenophonus apicola]UBX29526.1 tail fiber assembly protein [Arsenophonus apicola]